MSISSLSGSVLAASLSAAAGTCSTVASPADTAASRQGSALASVANSIVSVAIPGSPFTQQGRTSPGSLLVTPQMPPLLFDSQAETLLSSAVGSLVDTTA